MNFRRPSLLMMSVAATAITAASAATAIGWWHLGGSPDLGWPIWESRWIKVYGPWQAVRWWLLWSHDPGFRATFIDGLWSAGFFGMITSMIGLHLMRSFGPLPQVEAEEQPERYGTVSELLRSDRISIDEPGIVLGRDGQRIVYHVGDDHVLLVGASRVGEKTSSFVMPSIVDCPDSLVIFDPKSELHEATADERAKRGPVFLWDPTRPGTSRFNPLLELRSDERNIGDCRALATLMTHGMTGKDPFWAIKAADLCSAILRVICTDGHPRTLKRAREMALSIASGKMPTTTDQYAKEIVAEHLNRPADRGVRPGVDAQVQLAFAYAGDPIVANATLDSDFSVADLCAGDRPMTVYLTLPASQHDSLRSVARVVLQALLLGMLHHHHTASDGRPKVRRTTWLIDEFPQLGHLPFFQDGLAVAASYGIRVFAVCQDLAQIETIYGSHQTVLGNVGTFLWVPSLSKETYEHATAAAGTIIAALRARHRKVGVMDRPSETVSQSRHPVLNPRELQIRSRDEALVFHAGAHPTWLHKCRWYQHQAYAYRIKDLHSRY